jgi:hypothetical protein
MHYLLVLQQGEKELTHSFYVPPDQEQPTLKEIITLRRNNFRGWVLQEWLVK